MWKNKSIFNPFVACKKQGLFFALTSLFVGGCSTYPPPPIKAPFDVSKAGTVFEADFRIPYEWCPNYHFLMEFTDTVPGRAEKERERQEQMVDKKKI